MLLSLATVSFFLLHADCYSVYDYRYVVLQKDEYAGDVLDIRDSHIVMVSDLSQYKSVSIMNCFIEDPDILKKLSSIPTVVFLNNSVGTGREHRFSQNTRLDYSFSIMNSIYLEGSVEEFVCPHCSIERLEFQEPLDRLVVPNNDLTDLVGQSVEYLDVSFQSPSKRFVDVCALSTDLKYLIVSGNPRALFPLKTLAHLDCLFDHLVTLDASHNDLVSFTTLPFRHLVMLNASFNHLDSLPTNLSTLFPRLENLDLRCNFLRQLDGSVLPTLLQRLSVRNNFVGRVLNASSLPEGTDLANNQVRCKCDRSYMFSLVRLENVECYDFNGKSVVQALYTSCEVNVIQRLTTTTRLLKDDKSQDFTTVTLFNSEGNRTMAPFSLGQRHHLTDTKLLVREFKVALVGFGFAFGLTMVFCFVLFFCFIMNRLKRFQRDYV